MNNQEINQTEKLENTNIMPTNLQANSITPSNIIQTPSNNALEPIIPTQKAAEIASPKSEIVNTKNVVSTITTPAEEEILKNVTKGKKGIHIFFLFLELIGIGLGIYFIINCNEKYNTYTIIGADLSSKTKVYKAGKPYYHAQYVYKVNDKKYYYDYPKDFSTDPDPIIQLRYNPQKPAQLFSNNEWIFSIGLTAGSTILLFITIGILISITGKRESKIVTVIVDDMLTCVGGRKIYMRNIDTPIDNQNPAKTEYYSYYTNKINEFPIGSKIKFNAYKYNEVLTTEVYKNKFTAMTINEFKTSDFIHLTKWGGTYATKESPKIKT